MYCLIHSFILIKNFLITIGSQETGWTGFEPVQKQVEIPVMKQPTRSAQPLKQGSNFFTHGTFRSLGDIFPAAAG